MTLAAPAVTTPVPVLVADVETGALEPIAAGTAGSAGAAGSAGTAGHAWLLVRRNSTPIGTLRLPLPAGGLSVADLRAAVTEEFGEAAFAPVAQPDPVPAQAPPVTVVVCTRDRPDSLRRTLASLATQDYPSLDVLVVDSASRDGATREAAGAAGVGYLRVAEPGLSRARNAALSHLAGRVAGRGDVARDALVAWVDDDAVADRRWVAELVTGLLAHPGADVVCGAIVPAELRTAPQLWFEQFGGLVKGRGFTPAVFGPGHPQSPLYPLPPFGAGGNMLTRVAALRAIGGFDPALGAGTPAGGGEDTLAFTRILLGGGTIVYRPGALVRHYHREDLAGLERQLVGYGTGLTAAYTSLVLGSPRVLAGLVRLAPRALREVVRGGERTATIGPDFPPELLRANRRGMLRGPAAYLRGRRADRRLRAAGRRDTVHS